MPIRTQTIPLVLLFLTILTPTLSSPILPELISLRSQSPTGVIHLTDSLIRRILTSQTPRPFHLLIFFDAKSLHSKSELSLPSLKSEFSLLSSSYLLNNPDSQQLFFFDIEFQESQQSFSLFSVNSLPHIRIITPRATPETLKSESIQMDPSDYGRLADSMSEFVESKSNIVIGPLNRPPPITRNQIIFLVLVMLVSAPFFIKKLFAGNTIFHDKNVWMAGAIFVYFFSVSGAMFNIIRKMPMFMLDRNDPNKMVFFYQGSGMQLGAEGFSVGFLYTIVGLLLAFVTHLLVRLRNRNVQRVIMIVVLIVSFWAVKKVVFLDNWKTGYSIHGYWPSNW